MRCKCDEKITLHLRLAYPKWLANRIKEGRPDDKINEVIQKSWVNGQMDMFDYLK